MAPTRRVTDLDKFSIEDIWRPYANVYGLTERPEEPPMGLNATMLELRKGGEWAEMVMSRIVKCGVWFPEFVQHPLADFVANYKKETPND